MLINVRRDKTSFVSDNGRASFDPFHLALLLAILEFTDPDKVFVFHFLWGNTFTAIGTGRCHVSPFSGPPREAVFGTERMGGYHA
jgi:hypothetical protein